LFLKGIDPDSDEGLRMNPYESYHFKKMWLDVQRGKQKSEEAQFIEDFYARDWKDVKPTSSYVINTTNKINYRGEVLDVSSLTKNEVYSLFDRTTINESNELYFTEHVQSLFQISTPKVKLYYPEPYLASPSMIHEDL
jgi:hypothetical protein